MLGVLWGFCLGFFVGFLCVDVLLPFFVWFGFFGGKGGLGFLNQTQEVKSSL